MWAIKMYVEFYKETGNGTKFKKLKTLKGNIKKLVLAFQLRVLNGICWKKKHKHPW